MKLPGQLHLSRDIHGGYYYQFKAAERGASRRFRRDLAAGAALDLHQLFGFPTFYAMQMLANFVPGESRQLRAAMDWSHFEMLREHQSSRVRV